MKNAEKAARRVEIVNALAYISCQLEDGDGEGYDEIYAKRDRLLVEWKALFGNENVKPLVEQALEVE